MRRNELPDFCLSTLPSSGQLIISREVSAATTPPSGTPESGRKTGTLPERIIGGAAFLTYRRPP